jgi:hypothetical protein
MSLARGGNVLEDIVRSDMDSFQAANINAAKMFSAGGAAPASVAGTPSGVEGPATASPMAEVPQVGPSAPLPPAMDTFQVNGDSSLPAPIQPFDEKEDTFEDYNSAFAK